MKILLTVDKRVSGFEQDLEFFEKLNLMFPEIQFDVAESIDQEKRSIVDTDIYYGSISNEVFLETRKLKWIHLPGTGVDKIIKSIPSLGDSDVVLTNCRGPHAGPMANHVMGMILSISHRLNEQWDDQKEHFWDTNKYIDSFEDLSGKSMGILAFGDIGKAVAKRAHAFGMKIYAVDLQSMEKIPEVIDVWGLDQLDKMISMVDWFVVTAPFTKDTKNLIDKKKIGLLKKTSNLVVISRGGIVNEDALINALESESIAGAAIDTFYEEPLPKDSPFWDLKNCLISPHVSASAKGMIEARRNIFLENLKRYINKESFLYVCDIKAGF